MSPGPTLSHQLRALILPSKSLIRCFITGCPRSVRSLYLRALERRAFSRLAFSTSAAAAASLRASACAARCSAARFALKSGSYLTAGADGADWGSGELSAATGEDGVGLPARSAASPASCAPPALGRLPLFARGPGCTIPAASAEGSTLLKYSDFWRFVEIFSRRRLRCRGTEGCSNLRR